MTTEKVAHWWQTMFKPTVDQAVSTAQSPFAWAETLADSWSFSHHLQTPAVFSNTMFGVGQAYSVYNVFRQDWGNFMQTGNWSPAFWSNLSDVYYSGFGAAVTLQYAGPILAGAVASGVIVGGWPVAILLGIGLGITGAVAGKSIGDLIDIGMSKLTQSHNVGGILFENCDAVLTDIGEITGAYWDSVTQSLVFVGRDSAKEKMLDLKLPPMDRDHLTVALRAALAGQPIGVSIDPPAEYRESLQRGERPPDGTPMLVSYLGNTANTLFGAIMFEADRLLKCLDKGVDNVNGKPVRASVPGFKSLLEMESPAGDRAERTWHRFWFVIDKVELKRDNASGGIAFGDVRIKLLSEVEMDHRSGDKYVSPTDKAFTQHLTEHYDEYAREFPVLARLKELAKIAAVAKLLVNQGIPLDIGALFTWPAVAVRTPANTPGISATSQNVDVQRIGNMVRTRTVSLFGGVDMDARPDIIPDDGSARKLVSAAEKARPGRGTVSWLFSHNGSRKRALASAVGQARRPFQKICDDHEFASGNNNGVLKLRRVYNSVSLTGGEFGPGWRLWIPFSLTVLLASAKRAEVLTSRDATENGAAPSLVLHDNTAGKAAFYRAVSAGGTEKAEKFCRVVSQTSENGAVSFQYDPSDGIIRDGERFKLVKDGCTYFFDERGRLQEVYRGDKTLARYTWENGHVTKIGGGSHGSYEIRYEPSAPGRIIEVVPSSGARVIYSYDRAGLLKSCKGAKNSELYGYDLKGRLTEVRTPSGRLLSQAIYSDSDEQVDAPSDVLMTGSGRTIQRSFDRGRVSLLQDTSGARQHIKYAGNGELSAIQITGRGKSVLKLEYDSSGRLSGFGDSANRITRLEYDASGNISRYVGPQGNSRSYDLDESGRLATVTDEGSQRWVLNYDSANRLRGINGPDNTRYSYKYKQDIPVKITGPVGEIKNFIKRDAFGTKSSARNGMWQKQVWDQNGRVKQFEARHARPVRFGYRDGGQAFDIHNEAGTVSYDFAADELVATVSFEGA